MKSSSNSLQAEPQPRISVFITSYNQKAYLLEAIDSVLAQTLPPWEIIVVDDGSTDGSQDLIQTYVERYPDLIKPIFHKSNTGVTQSRIDALETVKGDYVTYVDGDDRFLPTKLEKEYAALGRKRGTSIAFSNNHYITPEGHFIEAWIEDEKPPEGQVFMQTFGRMYPKRSLYRMELVDYKAWQSIGFHDPNLTIHEDFDMRIRMTKQLQTIYCDEPLSEIRDHGTGLSSSGKKNHYKSLDYILQKNRPLLLDLKPTDRRAAEAGFRFWTKNVDKIPENKKDNSKEKTYHKMFHHHSSSYKGQNLIFVISQPRAGSTMLQRLIGGHDDIHVTAEPWIMLHPLYALKRRGVRAEYRSSLARQGLDDFLTQFPEGEDLYVESLRSQAAVLYGRALALAGKRYFLDKTPRYYHIIPELHRVFPEAKFVFLFRNPIAVLSSILNTWLGDDPEQIDQFLYKDLYEAPEMLLNGVQLLGEEAIVVNYEYLVARPEEELRRICTRLDLAFTSAILHYGQTPPPAGRFGDPTNVHKHDHPVSDYINQWEKHLCRPALVEMAETYLEHLGRHNLDRMGYVYDDIEWKIKQLKVRLHGNADDNAQAEEMVASGEIYAAEGHLNEAIQLCLQALTINPDFGKAHNNLGVFYYRQNEKGKALASYQKAVRLDPHNLCFKKNLADLCCYDSGPIEEAILHYRDILAQNPTDIDARMGLAHICTQKGQIDDARFFYQQVAEIDPDHQDALKMLALIDKGFSSATSAGQVKEMSPERARQLELDGHLEKALEIHIAILKQCPDDTETIATIASICMQLDRAADAVDFYLRVLEQSPEHIRVAESASQALQRLEEQQVAECNQSRETHHPAPDDDILVSAIVSVYKAERFIHACIEDLETQSIADRLEIIVIDSASPQNEKAIVKAFQDRFANIRYMRTKQRETVYAAWNRAIKAARGKYVTNANADDRHSAAALEIMARTLDKHPEVALVYADCIITNNENETFAQCMPAGAYRWLAWDRRRLLEDGCFMGPQPMWRRSLHEEYGYFDDTFVTSGDYEFWLRISQTYDFLHIPQFLGLYLRSPQSIEHSNRDRQKVENRKLRKWYRQALKKGDIIKRRIEIVAASGDSRIVPRTTYETARTLYEKGDLPGAVSVLEQSIAGQPDDWRAYRLLIDVILASGQAGDHLDLLSPLKARPDLPAELDAQIGVVYAAAGDNPTAIQLAHQARIKNSNCAQACNLEGLIAYGEGRPDAALAKFQKAAELAPDWGTPWTHMATLHWEREDSDTALNCFERGFALSPTAPNVASDYHTALTATGQFERARTLFEKTVQRHPNFRRAWYFLIDVLIRLNADEEAMAVIETVILNFGADDAMLAAAGEIRRKLGPLEISGSADMTLSLCMIVKNEGAHMARCLSNLKPVVDEMIVVDTGSSDATRDLSVVFGAKVFDLPWSDDFAAARNYSISKASGQWIIVMDADEVISSTDYRRLKNFLRKQRSIDAAFSITTRNYTNLCNLIDWTANDNTYPKEETGTGWTSSEKVRLFPNRPEIRFDYPVHEVVKPSLDREGIRIEKCPVPVHHYGQLDQAKTALKGAAYYHIGIKKIDEMGHDPLAIQELAVQAGNLSRWEEAVELGHKLLAIEPDNARAHINLSAAYDQLGRHTEARNAALRVVDSEKDLKEAYFNIARADLHLGRAAEATAYLKPLVAKNRDYYAAQFTLGCARICDDHMQEGLDIISRLKTTSLWPAIACSFEEIAQSLLNAGQSDYSAKIRRAVSNLELSVVSPIDNQEPVPALSRVSTG